MPNHAHLYRARSGNYYISFHHPICREGSIGKKIHRSLKVNSERDAETLRDRLDQLLSLADTPALLPSRSAACTEYPQVVVEAFYDCMTAAPIDYLSLREAAMPLPPRVGRKGLTIPRVLVCGGTGNGKSRFVQHLLGTTAENFPMRGAGRTTVSDTEIIAEDCDYSAILTFSSRSEVAQIIRESIVEACTFAQRGANDSKIASKLFVDSDKRFRFNYVIGDWSQGIDDEDDENLEEKDANGSVATDPIKLRWTGLENCIKQIRKITEAAIERSRKTPLEDTSTEEEWLEFVDPEQVEVLAEEIVSELENRLCSITGERSWPAIHHIADIADRKTFFLRLQPFYQNQRSQFGRLVTPLVQGIRVRGRFFPPTWASDKPLAWVLLDGQGVGHEQLKSSNIEKTVPPELAGKFSGADVICLVDKAMPAMTGDSPILLEHLLVRGYLQRLALVFTHFEAVDAPDLNTRGKKAKVLEGVSNAIQSVTLPKGQKVLLEQNAEEQSYFLASLDEEEIERKSTKNEVRRLCDQIRVSVVVPQVEQARPKYNRYDIANLVSDAVREYRSDWSEQALSKPNYKVIEALTNWIGNAYRDGYPRRRLYPGQNLAERLMSRISVSLESPREWMPSLPTEEEQSRILNAIRHRVADELDSHCRQMVIQDPRSNRWLPAYRDISGPGTKKVRARTVARILEDQAQLPDEGLGNFANAIWEIVEGAIDKVCDPDLAAVA